jgi:Mn-dependent DtxR family transcriptional regulator
MNRLTKRERDCLFSVAEITKDEVVARLYEISKKIEVSSPTTHEIIRRLETKGLIKNKHGSISITKKGMRSYHFILSTHRSLESIFSNAGIDPDKACEEIKRFDYKIDGSTGRMLINTIRSTNCPHGKPIR